jgi:dephospho-CoA kinase
MSIRGTQKKAAKLTPPQSPFEDLKRAVAGDAFWAEYLRELSSDSPRAFAVHLAVFVEPFLQFVLDGRKTIESRFSSVRCPPYGCVRTGDVVLLKRTGGPVVGLCEVGETWSYTLDRNSWSVIRREFTEALCAQDPEFWTSRAHASYATLMRVRNVRSIHPIRWEKRDRRGWVVLRSGLSAPLFKDPMNTTVIGIAGGISSGKSTVSEAVATALGCPRVSFGEYVKAITRERALADIRENWQSVGESLVEDDVKEFCAAVLAQVSWKPGMSLVIDGIRHVSVLNTLRAMVAPSDLRLIYISLDKAIRKQRYRRSWPQERPIEEVEQHSTERQVRTILRNEAQLVVDGKQSVKELVRQLLPWAQQIPRHA